MKLVMAMQDEGCLIVSHPKREYLDMALLKLHAVHDFMWASRILTISMITVVMQNGNHCSPFLYSRRETSESWEKLKRYTPLGDKLSLRAFLDNIHISLFSVGARR